MQALSGSVCSPADGAGERKAGLSSGRKVSVELLKSRCAVVPQDTLRHSEQPRQHCREG